jgi:hypothetical protein
MSREFCKPGDLQGGGINSNMHIMSSPASRDSRKNPRCTKLEQRAHLARFWRTGYSNFNDVTLMPD